MPVSVAPPGPLTGLDTTFVPLPGGTYVTTYGDTVEVAPFRLGRYEVTNRLYRHLAAEAGLQLPPDPEYPGMPRYIETRPDYPAVNMSAPEALSAAGVLGGRLPTRAELEYAASLDLADPGPDSWPWGSLEPLEAGYPANFLAGDAWETRAADGFPWTAPVDSFPLTDAGFACLAGNVAEWTVGLDTIPAAFGGAWLSPSEETTIGSVQYVPVGDRARHIGFRIVLPEE